MDTLNPRPFKLYGASVEAKVLDSVRTVVREWTESWTAAPASNISSNARLVGVTVASATNWRYLASDAEHHFGINTEGDWESGVAELLYGSPCSDIRDNHSGNLAPELLNAMFADLAARFLRMPASARPHSIPMVSTALSAEAGKPGAGFMAIRASVTERLHLWLLLSPQFINSVEGTHDRKASRPNLVSPAQAIGSRRVRLRLELGTGEVTIEELSSLAIGDVIPLDHKLNDEINMFISGDTPVCRGFMGTKNGKVAVQLSSKS